MISMILSVRVVECGARCDRLLARVDHQHLHHRAVAVPYILPAGARMSNVRVQ